MPLGDAADVALGALGCNFRSCAVVRFYGNADYVFVKGVRCSAGVRVWRYCRGLHLFWAYSENKEVIELGFRARALVLVRSVCQEHVRVLWFSEFRVFVLKYSAGKAFP